LFAWHDAFLLLFGTAGEFVVGEGKNEEKVVDWK
jgi:hypothetical protein